MRLIDVIVAALAIVLTSPVLIGIATWLCFGGVRRVIHSEERVGLGGRLFRIHKFRSMRDGDPMAPAVAAADDPRISAPGRFLRRWRLDELPQFFDVLSGHMSLVGPRPQKPENLADLDPRTCTRLQRFRPGITGPAAVEFLAEDEALVGTDDPAAVYRRIVLPEKVRLELDYLERRSLLGDLRILWLTAVRMFSKRARTRSLARVRSLIEQRSEGERVCAGDESSRET